LEKEEKHMNAISRRSFLNIAALTGAALHLPNGALAADDEKPNIVFIMADDMGYGDPQCYNPMSRIPTPNMDALARQGILFTDAHTSASVCTPSRYGILTGRYCWRTRLKKEVLWTTFDEPLIEKDRLTVASLAKTHGYTTACIGKWHLGMNFYKKDSNEFARGKMHHNKGKGGYRDVDFSRDAAFSPNDVGFDFSFVSGGGHNMEPHCFIRNRRPVTLPTEWREAKTPTRPESSGRESHEGWMSPGWIDEDVDIEFTRQAVSFIEQSHSKKPDKPFFLYLAPVSPHRPCVPTEDFKGKTKEGLREDFVAQYDWTVGEIMKVLDRLKLKQNTLLIVTSDNGAAPGTKDHSSSGKLRGKKGNIFEGGHRVPFIASWPDRIKAGTTSDAPICLAGLLATCAEIFNDKLPDNAGEDSFSFFAPLLNHARANQSPACIIHHGYSGSFAIRLGDWKLIPDSKMLFDMRNDPYETTNLFAQKPEIVKRLSDRLQKCRNSGRSR
jgi:arylsulfatase A-like enzyme